MLCPPSTAAGGAVSGHCHWGQCGNLKWKVPLALIAYMPMHAIAWAWLGEWCLPAPSKIILICKLSICHSLCGTVVWALCGACRKEAKSYCPVEPVCSFCECCCCACSFRGCYSCCACVSVTVESVGEIPVTSLAWHLCL